jgi:hypothetical protein
VRRSILVFVVAASPVACGSILGIPSQEQLAPQDSGESDGAVARCGIAFSDPCRTCAEAKCCNEASTCAAAPVCNALESCLAACRGEPACRSQCTIDYPVVAGAAIPAALDACLAFNCEDACELTCGALSKLAEPSSARACDRCIQQKYCPEAESCAQSIECQRNFLCRENCVTGDCTGACSLPASGGGTPLCRGSCGATTCIAPCSAGPDGGLEVPLDSAAALYAGFYGPVSGLCQSECQAGGNWACVGHVQWPAAKALKRTLTLGLAHFHGGVAADHVTVNLCGPGDPDCGNPIDTQVTDASGLVRLIDGTGVVNGQANGLLGHLDLSSPSLYPSTVYWGFPLSEPEGVLSTPLPVFSMDEWLVISILAGVHLDSARGHIAMVVVDCLGNQSAGVTFSVTGIDEGTSLVYAAGSTLRATGPTDAEGAAFLMNVPVNKTIDISAVPVRLGMTSAHVSVSARAGTLTEVSLAPNL